MEKMKTENINDVIRCLESIFEKLDGKKQEKGGVFTNDWISIEFNRFVFFEIVNYCDFKKLMFNHYGVDIENEFVCEYFE